EVPGVLGIGQPAQPHVDVLGGRRHPGRERAGQGQGHHAGPAQESATRETAHDQSPFWSPGYQLVLPRAAVSASQAWRIRTARLATSIEVSTPSFLKVSVTRLAATAHTLPPRRP